MKASRAIKLPATSNDDARLFGRVRLRQGPGMEADNLNFKLVVAGRGSGSLRTHMARNQAHGSSVWDYVGSGREQPLTVAV